MNFTEMVALIRGAFREDETGRVGGVWADFGAGTGNFTRALGELVSTDAVIYAIDRDARDLAQLSEQVSSEVRTVAADFTQPLDLPLLDGAIMANALHFVRDQRAVLARIRDYLKPGGRIILVEYDMKLPRSYVPFPVSETRFGALMAEAGFGENEIVGRRKSPSSGVTMYAGTAVKVRLSADNR